MLCSKEKMFKVQNNVQVSTRFKNGFMSGMPKHLINQLIFAMATLLGLMLKLIYIRKEFWHDEAFQLLFAKMPMSIILGSNDVHPPLYTILTKFMLLFTENIFVLRTVTLILSVMFGLYFYHTVKEWFGEDSAVIAYLFLSLSTTFAFYSVELRAYILVLLLTIIQVRHFSRMLQGKKYSESIYVLTSALMIYSHYTAGLIIATQLFYLLGTRKFKDFYMAFVHLFALSIPLQVYFLSTLPKIKSFWFEQVNVWSYFSSFVYMVAKPDTEMYYVFAIFIFCYSGLALYYHLKRKLPDNLLLSLSYLFIPITLMWVINRLGLISMYHHRYFLFGGMFLFVVAAYGMSKIGKVVQDMLKVGFVLIGLAFLINYPSEISRPVYDSAQFIDEPGRINIVHTSQWSQSPYKWLLPEHNHYLITEVPRDQRFTAGGTVIMDWEVVPMTDQGFMMPDKPYYLVTDQETIGGDIIYAKEGLIVKKYQ